MLSDRFQDAQGVFTEFRNREIENPDDRFDPGTVVTSITAGGSNLTASNGGNGAYTISISSTPNFTSVSIGGTPIGTIAFATKMANVPDTATSPGAAYVQAEVVSILTEFRALKTEMIAKGLMA